MDGYSRKDEGCPQLLDLISRDKDWLAERGCSSGEKASCHGLEKKLELSLGPPGAENWTYFTPKNPVLKSFLHLQPSPLPVLKESSAADKKPFSSPPPTATTTPSTTAQKRTAPAPVVGWPPIRSFRKNLASGNSSKSPSESSPPTKDCSPKQPAENSPRTPFVKINMDGIPIGRKVDLKAYDSYEKLSYAVDELFRGLLAAQRDCSGGEIDGNEEGIGKLLDGSGEYTLVYEDNEGDRMLVGDVPWDMFVASVKRLRVLKSSELPKLSRGSKQGRLHK